MAFRPTCHRVGAKQSCRPAHHAPGFLPEQGWFDQQISESLDLLEGRERLLHDPFLADLLLPLYHLPQQAVLRLPSLKDQIAFRWRGLIQQIHGESEWYVFPLISWGEPRLATWA